MENYIFIFISSLILFDRKYTFVEYTQTYSMESLKSDMSRNPIGC